MEESERTERISRGTELLDSALLEDREQGGLAVYRAVRESSLAGFFFLDEELTSLDVNERYLAMCGFSRDEVIGRSALDLVVPEDRERVIRVVQTLIATSDRGSVEARMLAKTGELIPVLYSGIMFSIAGHRYLVGFAFDLSEQREVEQQLRVQTTELEATLDAVEEGILVLGPEGTVTHASRRLAEIFPGSEAPANGMTWDGVRDLVSRSFPDVELPEVFRLETSAAALTVGARSSISGQRVELVAYSLGAGAQQDGLVWTFRDITQRLKLEEQVRRAERMASIEELAGGIAHDFNNVLHGIRAACEVLLIENEFPATVVSDLTGITAATERAAGMTRQLMAFSRKQAPKARVVDVHRAIKEHRKMLGRMVGPEVKLEFDFQATRRHVMIDDLQLQQALMNLTTNARDAMPSGGTLTVSTKDVPIEEIPQKLSDGTFLCLSVRDNGAGMPVDVARRAFEPFYTTKTAGQGIGLGLATVRGIVEHHGGAVELEAELGVGTTVRLCLPTTDEEASEHSMVPASSSESLERSRGTVLLVDKDDAAREMDRRTLVHSGYEVIVARTGADAIAVASRHAGEVDVLIAGPQLPDMTGVTIHEELCRIWPRLPMLVVSGYPDDKQASAGRPETMSFLQKPFSATQLRRVVAQLLQRP